MLTQFTYKTKAILIELLTRGIEAIKTNRMGEIADLGIFARTIPAALAIYLDDDGFAEHKEAFLEQYNGEFRNPELQDFLLDFTGFVYTKDVRNQLEDELHVLRSVKELNPELYEEYMQNAMSCQSFERAEHIWRLRITAEHADATAADDSGNADADADADADVGTDLDEANATANAIANESIDFANYSGKVNISQDDLRGLVESRTAIDAEPEPVL